MISILSILQVCINPFNPSKLAGLHPCAPSNLAILQSCTLVACRSQQSLVKSFLLLSGINGFPSPRRITSASGLPRNPWKNIKIWVCFQYCQKSLKVSPMVLRTSQNDVRSLPCTSRNSNSLKNGHLMKTSIVTMLSAHAGWHNS